VTAFPCVALAARYLAMLLPAIHAGEVLLVLAEVLLLGGVEPPLLAGQ
jgi:hypothetical protein